MNILSNINFSLQCSNFVFLYIEVWTSLFTDLSKKGVLDIPVNLLFSRGVYSVGAFAL